MARGRGALGAALSLALLAAVAVCFAPLARASFDCGTVMSRCWVQIDDSGRVWFSSHEKLTEDALGDGSRKNGVNQVYERSGNRTVLVSRYPDGTPIAGDNPQRTAARLLGVSPDGERVYLRTEASLLPEDLDGGRGADSSDVYAIADSGYELLTTGPLDSDPNGSAQAGGSSFWASDDGRYAYFETGQRLVPEDWDDSSDIYQRFEGQTRLVSTGPEEILPTPEFPYLQNPQPWFLGVSADGATVYFSSGARLTADDTAATTSDIFAWRNGVTTRLTHTVSPEEVPGAPWESFGPGPSFAAGAGDGSFYFTAQSPQVPEDTDAFADVYRLRPDGALERVIATAGASGLLRPEAVSRDGTRIFIFATSALVPGDHDQKADVYMWTEGRFELVSVEGPSARGEDETTLCSIADDGHRAYLETWARLTAEDTDDQKDVYEWRDGRMRLVSPSGEGREGPALCTGISPKGRFVAFVTWEELVPGDSDDEADIYVVDMGSAGAAPAAAGASALPRKQTKAVKKTRHSRKARKRRRPRLVTAEGIAPRMRTARVARLRNDLARLRVRCPKSERSGPCRGWAKLLAPGSRRVLGRGKFRIAAGRAAAVQIRGRRLATRRSGPVRARVRAADLLGNRRTITGKVKLRRIR